MNTLLKPLYLTTVLAASLLMFTVQPMVAKSLLPWFGGVPALWSTCLFFFQLVLLLGYLCSHLLTTRLHPRAQIAVLAILAVAALLFCAPRPDVAWKETVSGQPPALAVTLVLLSNIGLPFLLVSTVSTLTQRWMAYWTDENPYRLYSWSNAGSIAALAAYPFLIEPLVPLSLQARLWTGCFALFALVYLLTLGLTLNSRRPLSAPDKPVSAPEEKSNPAGTPWSWFLLPFTTSLMLCTITNHVSTEISVIPLLWIIPLAVYLLTFIVCFSGTRLSRHPIFLVLSLLGSLLMPLLWFQFGRINLWVDLAFSVLLLASVCMFLHGELYSRRPPVGRLTAFYLWLSAGSAAGSLFVSFVAPFIFNAYHELLLAMLLVQAAGLAAAWKAGRFPCHSSSMRATSILVVSLCWISFALMHHVTEQHVLKRTRNFYGTLKVEQQLDTLLLSSGTTVHGVVLLQNGNRVSREPQSYYGRTSGMGLVIDLVQGRSPAVKIGNVGMGIATSSFYLRPADTLTYYEINPEVPPLAQQFFPYSPVNDARVTTLLGDGRLLLESQPPQNFDLLIVDAFTSDSVPVHLLTQEAMVAYLRHLSPEGILLLNVSNRHMDLARILASHAQSLGLHGLVIRKKYDLQQSPHQYPSLYIALSKMPFSLSSQTPNVRVGDLAAVPPATPWTDDFSNLLQILRLRRIKLEDMNY